MNLIDNEQVKNEEKKGKTIITIIIVTIIVLLLLSVGIIYMIYNIHKGMLKLNIDEKSISKFSSGRFQFEDDEIYVSIRDFAELVGYKTFSGNHTSEDPTMCYIQNNNEEASFTLNSKKIYKNILTETDNEYFDLNVPVKKINDKLYVTKEGMQIATNSYIDYDAENHQFTVYTLPKLVEVFTNKNNDSAVSGENADFSNQKALLYNMIVVSSENKFGVRDLDGSEIIGKKYASIKFIESSKEFIVTTEDKKMGILASDGTTKIQPTYDEIKQIDKDLKLYLVSNNNKYGVINQNGNVVVYQEYDNIGVDVTQFTSNNIKNQYLLFDNCIPVLRDKKWGIIDKTGKIILPIEYNEMGCIAGTETEKVNNNLLIIPEYEAIVVAKDKKYGIVDSTGKVLVNCILDSAYSVTTSGQDTYYMVQGETTVNIEDFFTKHGIQKKTNVISSEEIQEENANTTDSNTVAENNVDANNQVVNNQTPVNTNQVQQQQINTNQNANTTNTTQPQINNNNVKTNQQIQTNQTKQQTQTTQPTTQNQQQQQPIALPTN